MTAQTEPTPTERQDQDTDDVGTVPEHDASRSGAAADVPAAEAAKGLGLLQLVGSAFAAGLGVQSSKNRERDFKQGRAGAFILAGIVFTALFIAAVYGVVSLVLSNR